MERKYIDCRESKTAGNSCTVAIAAEGDEELLEAAVQHIVSVHGATDSPDLRQQIRAAFQTGSPAP